MQSRAGALLPPPLLPPFYFHYRVHMVRHYRIFVNHHVSVSRFQFAQFCAGNIYHTRQTAGAEPLPYGNRPQYLVPALNAPFYNIFQ